MSRNDKIIDENYLEYVRSLSCLICNRKPVDADHLKARGWEESKRNDYSAIPLCRYHHIERGQFGMSKFESRYGINLWQEVFYLNSAYRITRRDPLFEYDTGETRLLER